MVIFHSKLLVYQKVHYWLLDTINSIGMYWLYQLPPLYHLYYTIPEG